MTKEFTVSKAHHEDIPAVTDIWSNMAQYHASLNSAFVATKGALNEFVRHLENVLENDDDEIAFFVCKSNTDVIGYVLLEIRTKPTVFGGERYGFFSDLATLTTFRQRGIGTVLVKHAEDWFRAQGVSFVEANIACDNTNVTNLVRKMGYHNYLTTISKKL